MCDIARITTRCRRIESDENIVADCAVLWRYTEGGCSGFPSRTRIIGDLIIGWRRNGNRIQEVYACQQIALRIGRQTHTLQKTAQCRCAHANCWDARYFDRIADMRC